jgi:catechol 2,3-dioxygenase-like lactoylglutathione lyase family enzyme
MAELPSFAMHVSDISNSSAFLTEKLGFTLVERRPNEDIAYMIDSDGDPILLAGPAAHDLSSYLSVPHYIVQPGETIRFAGGDLQARQADLLSKGLADFQIKQNRIGDSILILPVFDNYTFHYIVPATYTFSDLLGMYARLSTELDEALAGLSEADMSLALSEESWSIRQIVHHIADNDMLCGQVMKVQLSAQGVVMERPPAVGNENVTVKPEYRDRPVASSVALSRVFHEHILGIVKYVPDAGERYISEPNGRQHTFSQMVQLIVGHTAEHLDEIWEIRRKYGK